MSVHDGHRARMRARFLENGLDNFAEHEALEMLLYHCLSRGDTNELAHRLIREFGSLPQVMEASVEELQKMEGVGKHTAESLRFFADFCRYYFVKQAQDDGKPLNCVKDSGNYLWPRFIGQHNEMVYLVCLDAKSKVLCCKLVGEGSINSASVSVRKIVEVALAANASAAILAHNHPGGLAVPSGEDVQTTRVIAKALHTVDIRLMDHLVFSKTDYVSLRESGYYDPRIVYEQL